MPPTGYQRDRGGRLVPEEPAASAVAEAFRRRALGASYTDLALFLEQRGAYPAGGNPHWSSSGVASLLRNPAYLGQARSGKVVKEGAHEAIVSRAEFDAAQGTRTLFAPATQSLAAQALLGGLIRCSGCGHTLKISGSLDKRTRARYPTYYCTGRYATGLCPSRATIRASTVDAYVEAEVLAALRAEGGPLAQAVEASEQIDDAARSVTDAEHELDRFITNPKLLTLLGEDRFVHGVEARQLALDEARATLATIRQNHLLADELTDGRLLDAWPTLTIQEKRRLLHGLLDRVVLRRVDARREKVPLADRTQIVLRGNVLLEHAG